MKNCTKCGERKPVAEFYHNYRRKDKRENACKECIRTQKAIREKYNEEQYRLRKLQWERDDFIAKKTTIEEVIREVIVVPHVKVLNEKIKEMDQRIESEEWKTS